MGLKRFIQTLGPYQSLALLAVPTATVEPLKLVAVAVAGAGHWITGAAMIVACYTLSLVVVERLFIIVKPKLLTIPWVAKIWLWFVRVRTTVLLWCKGLIGRLSGTHNRDLTVDKAQPSAELLPDQPALTRRSPRAVSSV
jgi:hypothetical protein